MSLNAFPWAWPPIPSFPTTLPPSGAAGGDLAGTYPNPTVPGLFGAGRVLQLVKTESIVAANTATIIPVDNTIPQNTEGVAYANLDTTITPLRATSSLLVTCFFPIVSNNGIGQTSIAIFRDAAADAIAANTATMEAANRFRPIEAIVSVAAAAAVATTFKVRFGPGAGTGYVLSSGTSAAIFGGVLKAYMIVQEIAA